MDTVLKRTEFHGELTFVFRRQEDGSYSGECEERPAAGHVMCASIDEARVELRLALEGREL